MAKVIMMEERCKMLEELGRGNTGVVMLMGDKRTNDLVAVKLIKRGEINGSVERDVVNRRSLRHENVIGFKEVMLTPTHLAIVMEYAAGGELYNRTDEKGCLSEDEARYFFWQIISGIGYYCHYKEICQRDLKLDNVLLDKSPNPCLKICDFGFSKVVTMEERYESLKALGSGNFGVARLVKDRKTGELLAVKYIERGKRIDEKVEREIINHRSLRHQNIIRFKEVLLTPTDLAIVMEYAAGGQLFDRICSAGRFSEDEARYFFQQLISGVSYCHSIEICHRDLKLENTLLDKSPVPRLKICDFGYSKSGLLHSQPKSTVGTPAYIAPEVLSCMEYDGKIADAWSCGVTLYVMLVGAYPFEDPEDPRNFKKTLQRILSVQYSVPAYIYISEECKQLLSRIFVADPSKRITLPEVKKHPWYLKKLPKELVEGEKAATDDSGDQSDQQSIEDIEKIIRQARTPGEGSYVIGECGPGEEESDLDDNFDLESEIDITSD